MKDNPPANDLVPYLLKITMADINHALNTEYAPSPFLSALNRVLPELYSACWWGDEVQVGCLSYIRFPTPLKVREQEKIFHNYIHGGWFIRLFNSPEEYSVRILLKRCVVEQMK